jgi:topoisomerase IV subunit A
MPVINTSRFGGVDSLNIQVMKEYRPVLQADEGDARIGLLRAGKQVFNLDAGESLAIVRPAEGDHVAVVGSNRKLLIFPLGELPVMARGKGVLLQRYKEGELADARVFRLQDGLSWQGTRAERTVTDLAPWLGKRGQAGRLAPHGFPKSNRFEG